MTNPYHGTSRLPSRATKSQQFVLSGGRGWSSLENGKLLALAATSFDLFLTADRNLEFQENLNTLPIAVLVLCARNNPIQALEPLVPEVLKTLNHIPPRTLRRVGA